MGSVTAPVGGSTLGTGRGEKSLPAQQNDVQPLCEASTQVWEFQG